MQLRQTRVQGVEVGALLLSGEHLSAKWQSAHPDIFKLYVVNTPSSQAPSERVEYLDLLSWEIMQYNVKTNLQCVVFDGIHLKMLNRKPFQAKHPTVVQMTFTNCFFDGCHLDLCYKLSDLYIVNCTGKLLIKNFNIKHLHLRGPSDFDALDFCNCRPILVYVQGRLMSNLQLMSRLNQKRQSKSGGPAGPSVAKAGGVPLQRQGETLFMTEEEYQTYQIERYTELTQREADASQRRLDRFRGVLDSGVE